jgi:COP9 signalosome complex subunit 3
VTFVRSLANVYSAISLSEMAPWLNMNPAQAEDYLRNLLADELLNASIEGGDVPSENKVLRFYYDPTTGPLAKSEKQRYAELVSQANRITMLTEQVRAADHRLNLTKEYLDHIRKKSGRDKGLGGAPEEHADSSWENMNDGDEDMMADLH